MTIEGIDADLLRRFIPVDSLPENHLNDLGRKAVIQNLPRGRILFKRGDENRYFHFLIEGTADLADAEFNIEAVEGQTDRARACLDDGNPHGVTAVTTSDVQVLVVERDYLDLVLTWDQAGNYMAEEVLSTETGNDWMSCLLQSHIFAQIPPANIQQLFQKFEEITLPPGAAVIRQGEPGDYFYVLKSGAARITRRIRRDGEPTEILLAEVGPGDVFGEDALIGDTPRNATVQMTTPSELMRLGKDDFKQLMEAPVTRFITLAECVQHREAGKRLELLDVRLPQEYREGHLKGARNLPLQAMRNNTDRLEEGVTYVTVCDGGRRSVLAAFILCQFGLDAIALEDPPKPSRDAA